MLKSSKKWQSYKYVNHLFYRELFVYFCMQRDDVCRIQQHNFICCSVFVIPELRKRRVHGHCADYHFRIPINKGVKEVRNSSDV